MFNDLKALGMGLIVFSIIIGVGTVILMNFAGSTAQCNVFLSGTGVWNRTSETCWNGTTSGTPTGAAYSNTNYLAGQLGSAGLAGWAPAVVAISVGLLFLGAFLSRQEVRK